MNRRSFIGNLAGALAGFAVLPPATTYERIWRVQRPIILDPLFANWFEHPLREVYYSEAYLKAVRRLFIDYYSDRLKL